MFYDVLTVVFHKSGHKYFDRSGPCKSGHILISLSNKKSISFPLNGNLLGANIVIIATLMFFYQYCEHNKQ